MSIPNGTQLGPYEIVGWLGAGGMGEVYRARDTRLGRAVAIKFVSEKYAADPGRLSRFEHEARAAGQINHPNILVVYDIGTYEGAPYIVSELLEGESLRHCLLSTAMAPKKAANYARQIAEGLAAAHEKGIVHRDLKPDNLFVTRDGRIKILDFGIAKLTSPSQDPAGSTQLATETAGDTVVGTAGYMSPEQVRGEPIDPRSDVFSFGAVLYEMLSGRAAFTRPTGPESMAAILRDDPAPLAGSVPPALARIVSRCLEKDRTARFQSARDLAFGLDVLSGDHPVTATTSSRGIRTAWISHRALPWSVAAVLAVAFVWLTIWSVRPMPELAAPVAFTETLEAGQQLDGSGGAHSVAFSPDGSQLAYVATPFLLYLRQMSTEPPAKPIADTRINVGVREPVFSPNSDEIVFYSFAEQMLKKIKVGGGPDISICPAETPTGISWGKAGIVFGQGHKGIFRVPAEGGAPTQIIALGDDEDAYGPQILPDGDHVLFTLAKGTARDRWVSAKIVVQSISAGSAGHPKVIIGRGTDARYISNIPNTDYIVYGSDGSLYGIAFDPAHQTVIGGPVGLIRGVAHSAGWASGAVQFTISNNGSLAYIQAPVESWSSNTDVAFMNLDNGVITPLNLPADKYVWPRVSPDDARVAFGKDDEKPAGVWIAYSLGSSGPLRLASSGNNRFPIFSSDGQYVAFQSDREDGRLGIFRQRVDNVGGAERLTSPEPGTAHVPDSWYGDTLIFDVHKGAEWSVWTVSVTDKKMRPFADITSSTQTNAVFSRDGRWAAFATTKGLTTTLTVVPFPAGRPPYTLQTKGSDSPKFPRFSPETDKLFYDPSPSGFEVAPFVTQPVFRFATPKPLPKKLQFSPPGSRTPYDVARDGRIVGLITWGQGQYVRNSTDQISVIVNWYEDFKALMAKR